MCYIDVVKFGILCCGVLSFAIMIRKGYEPISDTILLMVAIIALAIYVAIECNSDKLIIRSASSFFASREETYKCENQTKLECVYAIQEWQKDSVKWAERTKKILKDGYSSKE